MAQSSTSRVGAISNQAGKNCTIESTKNLLKIRDASLKEKLSYKEYREISTLEVTHLKKYYRTMKEKTTTSILLL
jgi:hypothetical protein